MTRRFVVAAAALIASAASAEAGPALAAIGDPYPGDVVACLGQAEAAMVRLDIEVSARFPGAIFGVTDEVSYFVTCDIPGFVIFSVSSATVSTAANIRLLNQFRAAF
jgi:hypothetical protein